MKKSVKLCFCDYCKQSIETISVGTCSICDKDCCKKCYLSNDVDFTRYASYQVLPICKHCIKKVQDVVHREPWFDSKWFPALTDYHMSWTTSLILMAWFFRHFYDKLQSMALEEATKIFVERCKECLADEKKQQDIKEKEQQILKEYQEKIQKLKW